MFDRITHDVLFAIRSLVRSRGVTAVAIASLAIGIAANATIFSLVHAVEFQSLPYPDSSRLVFLESQNLERGVRGMLVSVPDAQDVRGSSRTLELVSLTGDQSSVLREGAPRRLAGRRVDASFFDVLRMPARLGRVLNSSDREDSIVLSEPTWRSHFRSDPSLVGRAIRLDGGIVTVVGVMPERFDPDADFWTPFAGTLAGARRDDRQFTIFARLAPGASTGDAARELREMSARLAANHASTNKGWQMYPIELSRMHGRDSRDSFFLLQAAVGFVLLIACANIANILLARGARRRHEMALRVSLGATRARLLSGLLAESLILSIAGGAGGVLLAMWGIRVARSLGGFPDVIEPALSTAVLAFTAALSMLTGVMCGIVPALRTSAVTPSSVLHDAGRGTTAASSARLRSVLVVTQIACAVVLAACGALMLRTLANRQQVPLGFDPRGSVRGDISLAGGRYGDMASVRAAADAILDNARRAPGVTSAGAVTWALPTGAGGQRQITLPAADNAALPSTISRGIEAVTPGYFDAVGAAIKLGRPFTTGDGPGGAPVAIVNEELARHLWPGRNPVGESLRLGAATEQAPVLTVVGVVGTMRRSAMHDRPVGRVYVPYAQYPNASLTIVVRSQTSAADTIRELEASVHQADASLLIENVRTLEADVAQFLAPVQFVTRLLTGFGTAGLLLAALGVFGTMSYTVAQRQREMAVRAALGASRRDIFALVYGSALRLTVAGAAIGIVAASFAARALAGFVFNVSPQDPPTLGAAAALLAVVSLAACYRPARLAATADPMSLLRD